VGSPPPLHNPGEDPSKYKKRGFYDAFETIPFTSNAN
jgi:hypothetical protein